MFEKYQFIMKELVGSYYNFKYRTKRETHIYKLFIRQDSDGEFCFKLELTKSGNFGSVGSNWSGYCSSKDEKLVLEATQLIDWNYTFLDEERQEHVVGKKKTFFTNVNRQDNDIRLEICLETSEIVFYKTEPEIDKLAYKVMREIITHHNLDEKVNEKGPGIFWRISNLIFRCKRESRINDKIACEIICEYDLDIVKEEKRVINYDEVVRDHMKDKINFDENYKILGYQKLVK
jgi:hypothetical protein